MVWGRVARSGRKVAVAPRAIALLVATVAFTGCDPDPTVTPPQPDEGCTPRYPDGLTVTWSGLESQEYVDRIIACSSPFEEATYIRNESEGVFTLTAGTGGATATHLSEEPTLVAFREAAASEYAFPNAVLAPGAEVVVDTSPVTWTLSPALSAMWLVYDTLVDKFVAFSQEQAIIMLSGDSLRRQALFTCSLAAYQVGGSAGGLLDSSEPGERLLDVLGIGGTVSPCARAWLAADEAEASRGLRTVTWSDDLVRLTDDAAFISRIDTQVSKLRRFVNLVLRIR